MSVPLPSLVKFTGPGKTAVWVNPTAVAFLHGTPGGGTRIVIGPNCGVDVHENADDVARSISNKLEP